LGMGSMVKAGGTRNKKHRRNKPKRKTIGRKSRSKN
jgi:hypothetical protein